MANFNKLNAFAAYMPNGAVNLSSDTVKFLLTNSAPLSTNSVYTDISGTELANGNGYTTGGATATLVSSTQTGGTYIYKASLASPTWTATGSMGPFRYVVAYDSSASTKALIGWWDYGSNLTLSATNTFTVTLDGTNGVFQLA